MKLRKLIFMLSIAIPLLISNMSQVLAMTAWEETFENDENWDCRSFDWTNGILTTSDYTYSDISNGMLNMYYPDVDENPFGVADIKSKTKYGVWSFDFNPNDSPSDFAIAFIFILENDIVNVGGSVLEVEWKGYGIRIATEDDSDLSFAPGFRLFKYLATPGASQNLVDVQLGYNITGWNHIDIIRELDNKIILRFNGEEILSSADSNPWTKSEIIEFANFEGDLQIDNLRVIDYQDDDSNEDGLILVGWLFPVLFVPAFYIKRKKT